MKRIICAILMVVMTASGAFAASDSLKESGDKTYNEFLNKHSEKVSDTVTDYKKTNLFGADYLHDYVYSDTGTGKMGDFLRWNVVKKIRGIHTVTKFSNRYIHKFSLTPIYIMSEKEDKSIRNIVKKDAKKIKFTSRSDARNLIAVYKWVQRRLSYKIHQNNVYDAYRTKKGNCVSYAGLFYLACREKGIPCRIVCSEGHMWNIVKVGNMWYHCDATWDDGKAQKNWKYFLKGTGIKKHKLLSEYKTKEFKKRFPIKKSFKF